jgi:NAD(P)-dependent dehydrogenase (short-subunit alcohol dehydrogenase family)
MNASSPALVVTGASTGIGRAIVQVAVKNGAHVFASVRKPEDAWELQRDFGASVTPIIFDVTDDTAIRDGAARVAEALGDRRLLGLVNNAGIAVPGPLLHLSADEITRQFDVNLVGQHRVTLAFAPLLGVDEKRNGKPGRIVMMSSVGGRFAQPFVGPYVASKFALEGYAQSLRRELMLYGIDVIVIGPGAIATPIWDKADKNDFNKFTNTPYAPMLQKVRDIMIKNGQTGLDPLLVGNIVWRALTIEKPKARYAVVKRPFMDSFLPLALPIRWVDRITAKKLGFPQR